MLFGEEDRFGFADRIVGQPLAVQAIHDGPVEAFPCTTVALKRQIEQRQNSVGDPVFICFHGAALVINGHPISTLLPLNDRMHPPQLVSSTCYLRFDAGRMRRGAEQDCKNEGGR
jgi:hypothetical protein